MPVRYYCAVLLFPLAFVGGFVKALSIREMAEPVAVKFIFPQNHSTLSRSEVTVICMLTRVDSQGHSSLPELLINGSVQSWDEIFAQPVLAAHVRLTTGLNTVKVGNATLSVYVKGGSAKEPPKGWGELYSHPPTAKGQLQCTSCHAVEKQNGRLALGKALVPSACDKCHSELEFELKHHHPKQPMEQCTMCHSTHASSIKGLLKSAPKQLCARCHD